MNNNRPIHLVNNDNHTAPNREHVRTSTMRLIADLARDEYHQLTRQQWKQCVTTNDTHEWDDNDAA